MSKESIWSMLTFLKFNPSYAVGVLYVWKFSDIILKLCLFEKCLCFETPFAYWLTKKTDMDASTTLRLPSLWLVEIIIINIFIKAQTQWFATFVIYFNFNFIQYYLNSITFVQATCKCRNTFESWNTFNIYKFKIACMCLTWRRWKKQITHVPSACLQNKSLSYLKTVNVINV